MIARSCVLAAAALSLGSASCIYARIVYYNTPSLAAPSYFDERLVRATDPRALPTATRQATFALTDDEQQSYETFDAMLEAADTRAFVVLHDDELVYERYFGDVRRETRLPGFSISKTQAALLVGCAVDDGLIPTMQEPVVALIPALAQKKGYRDITLDHLLRMTSGIDFDEESNGGAVLYYSHDLLSHLHDYALKSKPGTHYTYGSINVELLWEVLHRQLKGRNVSDYFESRVWRPIGAAHDASWSLDSADKGVEKLFGGFNATARDHARLGLLYLHGGSLFGTRVVSSAWVAQSLAQDPVAGTIETTDGFVERGRYQWFLTADHGAFFAKGYNGQYVYVVPAKNAVFVRFGEGYGDVDWPALFTRLADSL